MNVQNVIEAGKLMINYVEVIKEELFSQQYVYGTIVFIYIALALFKFFAKKNDYMIFSTIFSKIKELVFPLTVYYTVYILLRVSYEAENADRGNEIPYLHILGKFITIPIEDVVRYFGIIIFFYAVIRVIGVVLIVYKKEKISSIVSSVSSFMVYMVTCLFLAGSAIFLIALHANHVNKWENDYVIPYLKTIPNETYDIKIKDLNLNRYEEKKEKKTYSISFEYKDEFGNVLQKEGYFTIKTTTKQKPSYQYKMLKENLGNGYEKGPVQETIFLPEGFEL